MPFATTLSPNTRFSSIACFMSHITSMLTWIQKSLDLL
jgi:hypothetical protein